MRLPVDRPGSRFLPLILTTLLAACGAHLAKAPPVPVAPANGPAADYPVVVGAPYVVDGVSYTPEDKLNYDQVGYAAADPAGGNTISGEHHTLPLPSYVEVTSLDTGKTILVRLERRGPMNGTQLIGLSQGALDQLGATPGTPVRVRRVNPPEEERALLRAGARAPARIDTPKGLVDVLRRKLPGKAGTTLAASTDLTAKSAPTAVPVPASSAEAAEAPPVAATAPVHAPEPRPAANNAPPALKPLASAPSASNAHAAPAEIGTPGQRDFPWVAAQQAQPKRDLPKHADTIPPTAAPKPKPKQTATAEPAHGRLVVQAGAFSTAERAQRVADAIGGSVSRSGKFYRVRTGPFETRKEAEASLAKVKAAGYSDARIY